MKISSVTHGYSEWMFVPYWTFWNIAFIFLVIEPCVQVFKIFNVKLDFCIVRQCSYCNITLLNEHLKKLNWYYCTILEYFIFGSPQLKAQVSFSGYLMSVVCLSVYPLVNFPHFWVLFSKHWANFNNILGQKGLMFKWSVKPFSKGTKYPWMKGSQLSQIKTIQLF